MRYLSVCSGIEAASVAWKPLGWTPVGYSEIEPFPRAVLEQRHGAVPVDWNHEWTEGQNYAPLFGDFTKIEEKHVGPVDLLVGGTPCQSFSIAGKRLGLDDPRGNLAIEFLALAKRVRARWLVWENVPGVYSSWSGEPDDEAITEWTETADFAEFLNLFRECGYRGAWRTIDAQYCRVDGFGRAVPQRRRRCFLVGHIGNDARSYPVLFDAESLRGIAEPRRKAREGASPASGRDPEGNSGACDEGRGLDGVRCDPVANTLQTTCHDYSGSDGFNMIAVADPQAGRPAATFAFSGQERDVAPTISARTNGGGGLETDAELDGAIVAVPFQAQDYKAGTYQQAEVGTFTAGTDRHRAAPIITEPFAFQSRIARNGRGQPEEICPTLNGADAGATSDMRPIAAIPTVDGWTVRKLTPRECERLQGFPDDFTAIQWRGKIAPDGPRYKAIGNSMAVNVMRWIGTRIALVESAVEEARAKGLV